MEKVFTRAMEVRFRDIDAMGHVNNAVFFTYFEEGRKFFFHEITGLSDPSAFNFIMAHVRCDYLRPIRLGDPVSLHMQVGDIGGKSFELTYKLANPSDDALVYAKGKSVQVCFDYGKNKSVAISQEMRTILEGYRKSE